MQRSLCIIAVLFPSWQPERQLRSMLQELDLCCASRSQVLDLLSAAMPLWRLSSSPRRTAPERRGKSPEEVFNRYRCRRRDLSSAPYSCTARLADILASHNSFELPPH